MKMNTHYRDVRDQLKFTTAFSRSENLNVDRQKISALLFHFVLSDFATA